MTDIKRGDQVYYRGEVWTVRCSPWPGTDKKLVLLTRTYDIDVTEFITVPLETIQRVEQVR